MSTQAKIVFLPSGKRGQFDKGTPVLAAARSLGVDIDSVCGGRALCGRCQVECAEGVFAKHAIDSRAAHLSVQSDPENQMAGRKRAPLAVGRRLSCQAKIEGDLVIDVPASSQMHRQVVRKEAEHRDIKLVPAVKLYFVEVTPADMHDARGDSERLLAALAEQWQLQSLTLQAALLGSLQSTLRSGKWQVTVAVRDGREVVAIWAGLQTDAYGLAVDIGSTTIAAHLCKLSSGEVLASAGIMNPQIRFGEDLMSRVSYVMMNPGSTSELSSSVRDGLNTLIASVTKEAGIGPDNILELVMVGNPIMHHLLLGIDPTELGGAPFALASDQALRLPAPGLDLTVHAGAEVYTLPLIAGHVGADCAGVILSEAPYQTDEVTLLVDVGTNAEIVLGNKEGLLACSSPTGPAFEGAQISAGQRAAPGAIERVRIDRDTLAVRFKVIGSDLWSDDSGFADSVQRIGVTGICGSGIIEAVAEMYLAGVLSADGVVDGSLAVRTDRIVADDRTYSFVLHAGVPAITVTQNDVRQIQLAKAALYAGIKLLMSRAGIVRPDRIRLAGAFGSHIDPKYAMALGLIPDCELSQVSSAGNAAGTGARIALLNTESRAEIEQVVRQIEKIETAVEPQFQEFFVDAMAFPHAKDEFDCLFSELARPPVKVVQDLPSGRKRRRRSRSV